MNNRSSVLRNRTLTACLIVTVPLAGCSNPFAGDCTALGVAGITATVVDSITRQATTATAVVRIEDGAYVEEIAAPYPMSNPPLYSGAVERTGTYRVTVRAAGYRDNVVENIRVNRGGQCNALRGVRLSIALARDALKTE